MLKQFLISTALISTTIMAAVDVGEQIIDPDFGLLSGVYDQMLDVSPDAVVTKLGVSISRIKPQTLASIRECSDVEQLKRLLDLQRDESSSLMQVIAPMVDSDFAARKIELPSFMKTLFWNRIQLIDEILSRLITISDTSQAEHYEHLQSNVRKFSNSFQHVGENIFWSHYSFKLNTLSLYMQQALENIFDPGSDIPLIPDNLEYSMVPSDSIVLSDDPLLTDLQFKDASYINEVMLTGFLSAGGAFRVYDDIIEYVHTYSGIEVANFEINRFTVSEFSETLNSLSSLPFDGIIKRILDFAGELTRIVDGLIPIVQPVSYEHVAKMLWTRVDAFQAFIIKLLETRDDLRVGMKEKFTQTLAHFEYFKQRFVDTNVDCIRLEEGIEAHRVVKSPDGRFGSRKDLIPYEELKMLLHSVLLLL
jgi:hypothetical protein